MIRLCGELCLFDITMVFPLVTDDGHLAVMIFVSRTGMASSSCKYPSFTDGQAEQRLHFLPWARSSPHTDLRIHLMGDFSNQL